MASWHTESNPQPMLPGSAAYADLQVFSSIRRGEHQNQSSPRRRASA